MEPSTRRFDVEVWHVDGRRMPELDLELAAGEIAVGHVMPTSLAINGWAPNDEHVIVSVEQLDELRTRVNVAPQLKRVGTPRLRFVIGPRPGIASNFSVFHGDRDVSHIFDVKSLALAIDTKTRSTIVRLELLAEVDVYASVSFAREGTSADDIEHALRAIAESKTFLDLDPEGLAKLSRRHLVELARQHRSAVLMARKLLEPVPAELCAKCNLPAEVHGHGEAGPESHAFEPSPAMAIARAGGAERIDVVQLDEHGASVAGLDNCLAPSDVKLEPGETLMVWDGEPPLVISSVEPASEGRRKRVYVHRGDTAHSLIAEARAAHQLPLGEDPRERVIDALKAGGAREVTP